MTMNRKHLLDPNLTAVVVFLAAWVVLAAMTLASLAPLGAVLSGPRQEAPAVRGVLVAGPAPHVSHRW
jgi:hypothetical protein